MHTLRIEAADGVVLETLAAGRRGAPLAVLLHGFPESGDAWRSQLAPLAEAGLRVLAPHQRGYAGSSRPAGRSAYRLDRLAADVLALADAEGADRFCVVGHDWGGVVAWHLAAVHPQRLHRAIVLNAPHTGTMAAHALRHPGQLLRSLYVGAFQLPWVPEWLLQAGGHSLLRRSLERSARRGAWPPGLLDRYQAQWAQPGALAAMLAWYRALPLGPGTPAVPIELPVTVLWGARDAFLQRGLADAGLALCRHGELVELPRCTHWLHHEAPDEVLALLRSRLA